jgi:hypothetical protein
MTQGEVHARSRPAANSICGSSTGLAGHQERFQLIMSLQTGPWTNALTAHYKSGYEDASAGDDLPRESDGSSANRSRCPKVPSYTTWIGNAPTTGHPRSASQHSIATRRVAANGRRRKSDGYDGRYNPIGRAATDESGRLSRLRPARAAH